MEHVGMSSCLHFISEILHVMKTTNQYERVLHLIVDRITRMYKAQICAVVLIDPKTEYLRIENSIGLSHAFRKAFRRKIATGPIGELLWTGKHIRIDDAREQVEPAEAIALEQPFASCVCVHIAVDNKTLGYLHVDSTLPGTFSPEDVSVLQTFADFAAVAMNKATLHDENLRLETHDPETGLEKLPLFLVKLEENIQRASAFNQSYATLILDVDNFKTIVNTYGHDASRRFLRELCNLVRQRLRTIDACARYGFDEVILGLSNMDLKTAATYAQELGRVIATARFTDRELETTVSIGVAVYPQNGKSVNDVVMTAKRALLEAQRAGRNGVFFYPVEWYASKDVLHTSP